MTEISLTHANRYKVRLIEGITQDDNWKYFVVRPKELPYEGWKLHVSGNPENAQRILQHLEDYLIDSEINFKFANNTEGLKPQHYPQARKFIVIYPNNIFDAFSIVKAVDDILSGQGIRKNASRIIPNEEYVGKTIVYSRYGGFVADSIMRRGLLSMCKPATMPWGRDKIKPKWVVNPWGLYRTSGEFDRAKLQKIRAWPPQP